MLTEATVEKSRINNNIINQNSPISPMWDITSYQYIQIQYLSDVRMDQLRRRISNIVENQTLNNMTYSIGCSTSQSTTYNISLSAMAKNAIKAVAGASWDHTLTYKNTLTMTIQPGYEGYYDFIPIMNSSSGDLYGYMGSVVVTNDWVITYSPKYTGSQLYGVIVAVTEHI